MPFLVSSECFFAIYISDQRMCRYLHGAKVLYRALAPELLMLSPVGYLQLMDYRYFRGLQNDNQM